MTDTVQEQGEAAALVATISAWEDVPRPASPEAAPVLSVDGFAGPLDWLLEMAQARKIDLARLSIVALIEAFATALQAALADRTGERTTELGRWGAWLVMAATLAFLRSRLLLPSDTPEARAAEDEAEALRRRLVSRAQVRAAADWLEHRPQLGRDVFECGTGQRRHDNARMGDITELLRACLVALEVPAQAEVYRPRPQTLWQVSDAIARLRQLLDALPDGSPLMAFLPTVDGTEPERVLRGRVAVSSTLVAGLELARAGVVALDQGAPWMPIRVLHRDDHSAVEVLSGLWLDTVSWAQEFMPLLSRPERTPTRRFWRGYRAGSPGQSWLATWATLRRAGEGSRPFGLRSQSAMIDGTVHPRGP